MSDDRRLLDCVKAWPDAESGMYDPHCCRFPKSCSPYPYDEQVALGNVELEPASSPRPAAPDTAGGELRDELAWSLLDGLDVESAFATADRVLALPALRDLLAERDTLAAQVQAVEGLADVWEADAKRHDDAEPINTDGLTRMILAARFLRMNASDLRRALGTATTGGGE